MIYIWITQTSGGRTGHKWKDLVTAFCLHFIKGWKILYDDSWCGSNKNTHNNHLDIFRFTYSSLVKRHNPHQENSPPVYTFKNTSWDGMTMDTLCELFQFAEHMDTKCGNVIIRLVEATRVLPNQLYNWGYKQEFFKLSSHLRSLYCDYDANESSTTTKPDHHVFEHKSFTQTLVSPETLKIMVHVRKGDCYDRVMHGFDHRNIAYYKNVMTNLYNKYCGQQPIVFNVISETWPGYDEKDVRSLEHLFGETKNCKVNIYMDKCLYEYFTECIESDLIVVTNGQGSFSDLCILYAKPTTKIVLCKTFRQFDFIDDMGGKLIFCDQTGNFYPLNDTHPPTNRE